MHSSNFLVVILLLIVQFTAQGYSRAIITHAIPDNDLRAHCSFNFNGYEYDLCRLVGLTRVVDVPEIVSKADGTGGQESNSGSGDYLLTLGGNIGDGDNSHAVVRFPISLACVKHQERHMLICHIVQGRSNPLR